MIHQCQNCQGVENVEQFLYDYLNPNDPNDKNDDREDDAEKTEIEFKQWTMTDRTELTSMILPQNEFINLLVEKLDNITTHSFIAKSQASYLKQLKYNRCRWGDCSGIFCRELFFPCTGWDSGIPLEKSQCSLHPVVVYIRSSNNLVESSLCILSENLNQDVTFVYKVIKETVDFIKKELNLSVKTIH